MVFLVFKPFSRFSDSHFQGFQGFLRRICMFAVRKLVNPNLWKVGIAQNINEGTGGGGGGGGKAVI